MSLYSNHQTATLIIYKPVRRLVYPTLVFCPKYADALNYPVLWQGVTSPPTLPTSLSRHGPISRRHPLGGKGRPHRVHHRRVRDRQRGSVPLQPVISVGRTSRKRAPCSGTSWRGCTGSGGTGGVSWRCSRSSSTKTGSGVRGCSRRVGPARRTSTAALCSSRRMSCLGEGERRGAGTRVCVF